MKAVSTTKETDWTKFGYTKKQSKQVNACYNVINETARRRCLCKTCGVEMELETAGGVLYFLAQHKGHDTLIKEVSK